LRIGVEVAIGILGGRGRDPTDISIQLAIKGPSIDYLETVT
jgi:hypothetical protein